MPTRPQDVKEPNFEWEAGEIVVQGDCVYRIEIREVMEALLGN